LPAVGYDKTIYIWDLADADGHLAQSLIADQDSLLALGVVARRKNDCDRLIGWVDSISRQQARPVGCHRSTTRLGRSVGNEPRQQIACRGRYNGTLSLYDAQSYKEARARCGCSMLKIPRRQTKSAKRPTDDALQTRLEQQRAHQCISGKRGPGRLRNAGGSMTSRALLFVPAMALGLAFCIPLRAKEPLIPPVW